MNQQLGAFLTSIDELTLKADPDEQPYRSRYQARNRIQEWQKNHSAEPPTTQARLSYRLGKIGLETEEPQTAELCLNQAIEIVFPDFIQEVEEHCGQDISDDKERGICASIRAPRMHIETAYRDHGIAGVVDGVNALNLMGVLWCNRHQHRRALLYLLGAEVVYSQADALLDKGQSAPSSTASTEEEVPVPEAENGMQEEARQLKRLFEVPLAHTSFYLAQVYGLLGQGDRSAFYCRQTLERQLASKVAFQALDWVNNCLSLADYSLNGDGDLHSAARCLQAAGIVLAQHTPGAAAGEAEAQGISHLQAEIARRWAAVYACILRSASELVEQGKCQKLGCKVTESQTDTFFPGLSLSDPDLLDPTSIKTYELARSVFLKAQKHLDVARAVFVLDGFVTDHVQLLRDQSRLYRSLSTFETDEKRQQAMYLRRATSLAPLLQELSPRAYPGLHKMLSFEVGEIYMELFDTKVKRIEAKRAENSSYIVKQAEAAKTHKYCKYAIQAFSQFCDMYRKDGEDEMSHQAWNFEKDDLRPLLRAQFHMARLLGKSQVFGDLQSKVDADRRSLMAYEKLRAFAMREIERHYGNDPLQRSTFFIEELAIVEDMLCVLPKKLARMHYRPSS